MRRLDNIDLRLLRVFVTIAEAGGFADAQIILTSAEFIDAIGKTNASVIVVENYFDTAELSAKLERALG